MATAQELAAVMARVEAMAAELQTQASRAQTLGAEATNAAQARVAAEAERRALAAELAAVRAEAAAARTGGARSDDGGGGRSGFGDSLVSKWAPDDFSGERTEWREWAIKLRSFLGAAQKGEVGKWMKKIEEDLTKPAQAAVLGALSLIHI